VLGRVLCSLGQWDEAVAEIESVKPQVLSFQIGMAFALLVVIALARGEDDRVRELVAEHDQVGNDAGASVFESDFRTLRSLVLEPADDGRATPAEIIAGAQVADYAEWIGWLAPVVDRLLAGPDEGQLVEALAALSFDARVIRRLPASVRAVVPGRLYPAETKETR
jgi:hypothetical protein